MAATKLNDTGSVGRDSLKGVPTFEKVADQGADVIATLRRFSGMGNNLLNMFGGEGGEPTSQPKPAGTPAPPTASPLGSPILLVGLAVVGILVFMMARKS